ncbi:MAG: hypothetical protein E7166_00785 [Firmicutes bacterium]|nr:hypothetical protein [Bacillota bacterium]
MKTERISVRVSEDEKKEISINAEKSNMNTSEYIYNAVMDKLQLDKLCDSQGQFLNLFDTSFKRSYDPYQKHLLVILNRIEFNTRWIIKQQDIFMQHIKVPQTKDDLNVSFLNHPITDIAQELVLKDIRTMSSKKKELENE